VRDILHQSQECVCESKNLSRSCVLLNLLLLFLRREESSSVVEDGIGAALTVSAFLLGVWIDQLDALDRRER